MFNFSFYSYSYSYYVEVVFNQPLTLVGGIEADIHKETPNFI